MRFLPPIESSHKQLMTTRQLNSSFFSSSLKKPHFSRWGFLNFIPPNFPVLQQFSFDNGNCDSKVRILSVSHSAGPEQTAMISKPSSINPIQFQPPHPVPGISFRLAQSRDLEMLWENCYPGTPWDHFQDHYEYLLGWQENGRCHILIAETTTAEIIGSGQLINQPDKAEIAELVVRDNYQNRGIGTAVIQILTQIAVEKGIDCIEIGAAIENQQALRLYRRLGFTNERQVQLPGNQKAIFLSKTL